MNTPSLVIGFACWFPFEVLGMLRLSQDAFNYLFLA